METMRVRAALALVCELMARIPEGEHGTDSEEARRDLNRIRQVMEMYPGMHFTEDHLEDMVKTFLKQFTH